MRDYRLYLRDILTAIKSIEDFTNGMDFDVFCADDKTASAVIRKFEIIGEATKQLPETLRVKHSEIPWKDIAGMRDRAHTFLLRNRPSARVGDNRTTISSAERSSGQNPG